ncbi:MAG: hypothetical protein ACRDJH_24745 [Thermomicrobiales bacterium]
MTTEQGDNADLLEQTVESVCRTIMAAPEIKAIHVVLDHRPMYGQLLRCRMCAEASGLELTVIGAGGVVLCRRGHREQGVGNRA